MTEKFSENVVIQDLRFNLTCISSLFATVFLKKQNHMKNVGNLKGFIVKILHLF